MWLTAPASIAVLAGTLSLAHASAALAQEASSPPELEDAPRPLRITVQNLSAAVRGQADDEGVLRPGDVIRYHLTFTNISDSPVQRIVLVDPVPDPLLYVGQSAGADDPDVRIDYSIDGGLAYAEHPVLREMIDGREVERPAPPESYTHVRWTITGWVQPNQSVVAHFDARFPGPKETEIRSAVPDSTGAGSAQPRRGTS